MLHVSEDRKTYQGLKMHHTPVFIFIGVAAVVLSLLNVEPEVMVDVVDALLDIAQKGK